MHKYFLLVLLPLLFACSATTTKQMKDSFIAPVSFQGTLSSHNRVRRKLALKPLRWSSKLALYAQEWANHLARTQNCFMQHRPHYASPFKQIYGENLFWAGAKRWSDGRVELQSFSMAQIVKAWADEVVDYDYQQNSCRVGRQCGHYTQIVWRESHAVGCAKVICADQSQLWVCNYDPPGNYMGEKPY